MNISDLENRIEDWRLAVNQGKPVRTTPMPKRLAMGAAETAMLNEAVNAYASEGVDPGYQGVYEKRYTDAFVDHMGGGYADAVATGTAAVYLSIAALGLPKNSEILVSPITDPGTISAIILNGLRPRLVDTAAHDYNIDVNEIIKRDRSNVSGLLVVHSAGQAIDIEPIVEWCKERQIPLIEDCSQSHGALRNGRPVGAFGDIAAFSTMYRKAHITGGSGGVVYSRNLDFFRQALAHADRGKPRWDKNFDDRDPSGYLFPALNWNTDELSCAIGIASIKRLNETRLKRIAFISELADYLSEIDTIFKLYDWRPGDSPFIAPVYVDFEKTKCSKKEIAEALRAEGIDLNPHYAYLVSDWPWVRPYLADDFSTPQARLSRDRSLCLYLNEKYTPKEAADVAAAMLKVHRAFLSA